VDATTKVISQSLNPSKEEIERFTLPMHILINGWFLNQLTTGSGQYLHQLMAQLAPGTDAPGAKVRFTVLYPATAQNANQHDLWPGVMMQCVTVLPLPLHLRKLWWEQISMPRAAQRFQADLLWIPYWAAPLWQPCPTVVTVHDIIHHLLPAYRGGRLQRLYTSLVSYTAQRAAAVITVSHAAARDIVTHLRLPAERVHVVYNGANHSANHSAAASHDAAFLAIVRQKYALPARFFLYLGGFDVRKNVATTLHAYRRYLDRNGDPTVRLVIAGTLPAQDSPFTPDPKKIAAELNLTTQVQFCGWIDEADKPAFYALATAYLFPSLYEGFGLMVIEAMQAGAPVITSGEWGMRSAE
jgi:glycosyltransferase involved in cell wall biosynthesis